MVDSAVNRPQNPKELFNLRHAELRNVVERIIGIFKKRFKIIREANFYPIDVQAKLVTALCALHNFIRIHDPRDDMGITQEELDVLLEDEMRPAVGESQHGVGRQEAERAAAQRDEIAGALWRSYQDTLDKRRERQAAVRRRDHANVQRTL